MFTYFLYLSILILVASFSYIAEYGNTSVLQFNARAICFLAMTVPAILRYGIGTDYFNYFRQYETMNYVEPGWFFFYSLCHKLGLSFWWVIAITSVLTYYMVCFLLPKRNYFYILTFYILLFCYLNSFSGIRQLMAMSFLLCGLSDHYYKKKLKAYLFFVIAVLFHTSSIIVFPIVLLSKIKVNKYLRYFLFFFGISIILFLDFDYFFSLIANSILPQRYADYYKILTQHRPRTGLGIIINMLISIVIMLNSGKMEKRPNGNFIINLNFFNILICLLAFKLPTFRLNAGLVFIQLFSLGYLLDSNKKYRTIYLYSFTFLELILFIRLLLTAVINVYPGVNPYRSIFNI
jgi:hypothetical protein